MSKGSPRFREGSAIHRLLYSPSHLSVVMNCPFLFFIANFVPALRHSSPSSPLRQIGLVRHTHSSPVHGVQGCWISSPRGTKDHLRVQQSSSCVSPVAGHNNKQPSIRVAREIKQHLLSIKETLPILLKLVVGFPIAFSI